MARKKKPAPSPDDIWDFRNSKLHQKAAAEGMPYCYDAFDTAPETVGKRQAREEWVKRMDWKYREKKGL